MGIALSMGSPTNGRCPLPYCNDWGQCFSICWEMVLTVLKQGHIFALFSLSDGSEIAGSTLMEILLMNDFKLVINKVTYDVRCPKKGKKHSCATLCVSRQLWGTYGEKPCLNLSK